jgi:hypothetical protein
MPAGGPVARSLIAHTGSNTGNLGLKQMQGDASDAGDASEAEPCPEHLQTHATP